jgi:protein SCO1/2
MGIVAYKFGLHASSPDAHKNIIIVGNEATGLWKKLPGVISPEELVQQIREVLNDQM